MLAPDYTQITFQRLPEVNPDALIALMNDPDVRRHLPLARGEFGASDCERFVAAKEWMWEEVGYGPWAFVLDEELVGWGGLQPEGDDADVGMVLHRARWGAGRVLYERILDHAFGELALRLASRWIEPDLMRRAFGWDPHDAGC